MRRWAGFFGLAFLCLGAPGGAATTDPSIPAAEEAAQSLREAVTALKDITFTSGAGTKITLISIVPTRSIAC